MTGAQADTRPVAIVTGGSRGIGKAIVESLAAAGFRVRFSYVSSAEAATQLVEQLAEKGQLAQAVRVDSRDIKASSELVSQTIADWGRLDVLINNAAITADKLLPMMGEQEWSSVLETSLNGLYGTTRIAAKQMMRQKSGRIITITSVSGVMGIPGQTNYSAAKAAIIGFTRSLSKELAAWNVPVNAIAPGAIDTDMLGKQTPEQRAAQLTRIPMKRVGTSEEIAVVARFLATEAPTYLTGQTLVVDGGMSY